MDNIFKGVRKNSRTSSGKQKLTPFQERVAQGLTIDEFKEVVKEFMPTIVDGGFATFPEWEVAKEIVGESPISYIDWQGMNLPVAPIRYYTSLQDAEDTLREFLYEMRNPVALVKIGGDIIKYAVENRNGDNGIDVVLGICSEGSQSHSMASYDHYLYETDFMRFVIFEDGEEMERKFLPILIDDKLWNEYMDNEH